MGEVRTDFGPGAGFTDPGQGMDSSPTGTSGKRHPQNGVAAAPRFAPEDLSCPRLSFHRTLLA